MIKLIKTKVDTSLGGSIFGCSQCCFNDGETISCHRPDDVEGCNDSETFEECYFSYKEDSNNE